MNQSRRLATLKHFVCGFCLKFEKEMKKRISNEKETIIIKKI